MPLYVEIQSHFEKQHGNSRHVNKITSFELQNALVKAATQVALLQSIHCTSILRTRIKHTSQSLANERFILQSTGKRCSERVPRVNNPYRQHSLGEKFSEFCSSDLNKCENCIMFIRGGKFITYKFYIPHLDQRLCSHLYSIANQANVKFLFKIQNLKIKTNIYSISICVSVCLSKRCAKKGWWWVWQYNWLHNRNKAFDALL